LIDRFGVSSVLDLGSGMGYCAKYLFERRVAVIAVDGLGANVANAVYPTVQHDLRDGPFLCHVDLVHCQEVVEHIEDKYLDNLMLSLTCGKIIVISHAMPEQGGYHHVNLQESGYWVAQFAKHQCEFLPIDTERVREKANKEGATHLGRSALVFANRARL
jgi:hypothetical protein